MGGQGRVREGAIEKERRERVVKGGKGRVIKWGGGLGEGKGS